MPISNSSSSSTTTSKPWIVSGLAVGAVIAVAVGAHIRRSSKFRNRVAGIIPARFASSRLQGKPLVQILGKPMIQRTWERAKLATTLDNVVVATDDEKIADCCRGFGAHVIMTPNLAEMVPSAVMKLCKSLTRSMMLLSIYRGMNLLSNLKSLMGLSKRCR